METASKKVVQKTTEATGDMIRSKIADKINSLDKTNSKEKEDERQEIYIPPEKRQQIIDDLRLFWYHIKIEYQKITNLLGTTSDNVPRFITKKWIEVHDQSGSAEDRYKPSKQIRFKTSMLRSDLCDFSDAYIVVKGTITVIDSNNEAYDKKLAFKSNASFVPCISKVNNTLIDSAEDLDIVMPMYNLIEYCKNYSKTTGSFSNYDRDEPNSGLGAADKNINYSIKDSKSFDYKANITGKLEGSNTEIEVGIVVSLKHLSNFWRTLDMLLINCETKLILTWSEKFLITNSAHREKTAGTSTDGNTQFPKIDNPTNAIFKITDTKLYLLYQLKMLRKF